MDEYKQTNVFMCINVHCHIIDKMTYAVIGKNFNRGNDTVQIIPLSNQKPGTLTNYKRIKYNSFINFKLLISIRKPFIINMPLNQNEKRAQFCIFIFITRRDVLRL